MEKLNIHSARHIAYDVVSNHIHNLGEAWDKKDMDRFNSEIDFYNRDLRELYYEAIEELDSNELVELVDELRSSLNIYYLSIFNPE